jgi:hypothetical protein
MVESHLNIAFSSYLSFTVSQKVYQALNPISSQQPYRSSNPFQREYFTFILRKKVSQPSK